MTYQELIARHSAHREPVFHVEPPTLQEWTAAHQIGDASRRSAQLGLLHDRLRASRMAPWEARLYLKRHVIGFIGRWSLMAVIALWVSPWMWLPIIGIPAVGAWKAWQATAHG